MRLDKYVWSVRLFKTRSVATKACNEDKVMLNDQMAKASKTVAVGDHFSIKNNPIWRTYKILDIPKSRVGAKLVETLIVETTTDKDLELLKRVQEENRSFRETGFKGRPTKKLRRDRDKFNDDWIEIT